MSIQAVAWVLAQSGDDLPGTGRLVMIALANHADHTSGHCWPSVKTIASEAGCSDRTASRYLYALSRNGFIEVRRTQRKSGQFRSNDYWILFERKPAPWQYFNRDPNDEPEDEPPENEPSANLADGQDGSEPDVDHRPDLAAGPSDTVGSRHKKLEPSESEPSEAHHPPTAAVAPQALPKGFEPSARSDQQAKLKAAEEARKAKPVPVIEGSDPWNHWVKHGHSSTLVGKILLPNGRVDRGWYFPTLYPPKETGPPE